MSVVFNEETRWVVWKAPEEPAVHDCDESRVKRFVLTQLLIKYDPIQTMTASALKNTAKRLHINIDGCVEGEEIRKKIKIRRSTSCPICFDVFEDNEQVAETKCGHAFCAPCLVKCAVTKLEEIRNEREYYRSRGETPPFLLRDGYPPCPICKCPIDQANA